MSATLKIHTQGQLRYDPQIIAAEISKLFGLELPASMIMQDGVRFDDGFLEITLVKIIKQDDWRQMLNAARVYPEPNNPKENHTA